jgi:hypothetical protein
MILTCFKRTFQFFLCGIGVIVISCVNEFFFGTGLTHPMWDPHYNWLPILAKLLIVSLFGAAALIAAGQTSTDEPAFDDSEPEPTPAYRYPLHTAASN